MNLLRLLTLTLFTLTLSQAETSSLTKELYLLSGLKEQVRLLSPTLKHQINQAKEQDATLKTLPDAFMNKLSGIIESAFNAQTLDSILLAHIDQRMSQNEIKEVLAWYRTKVGKKCVALESRASSITGMDGLPLFVQNYLRNPLPASRIKLLNEFSEAIGFYEYTKTLAVDAGVTMLMAFTASMPAEQRPTIFQVRSQIEAQLEQNKAQFAQETFVTLAYIYEKLNENEIQSYIRFAQSAAGSAFMQASLEALSAAMSEGAKHL